MAPGNRRHIWDENCLFCVQLFKIVFSSAHVLNMANLSVVSSDQGCDFFGEFIYRIELPRCLSTRLDSLRIEPIEQCRGDRTFDHVCCDRNKANTSILERWNMLAQS